MSAPEYASLLELSKAADVIVTGVVTEVLGTEVDEGSNGSGVASP